MVVKLKYRILLSSWRLNHVVFFELIQYGIIFQLFVSVNLPLFVTYILLMSVKTVISNILKDRKVLYMNS